MSERIDHAAEARDWLADAPVELREAGLDSHTAECAALCVGMAQAEATLALVEVQREANEIARAQALIALGQFRVGVDDLPHLRYLVLQPVGEYGVEPTPEIARALGIDAEGETDEA